MFQRVALCVLQAVIISSANDVLTHTKDYYNYEPSPFDYEQALYNYVSNPEIIAPQTEFQPARRPILPPVLPANLPAADALQNFTFKLLGASHSRRVKNLVVSPLSIYTALALLRAGLNGTSLNEVTALMDLAKVTDSELHDMYHALEEPSNSYELSQANGLYVDESVQFLKTFRRDVKKLHVARARRSNFATVPSQMRNRVNRFVKRHTDGKIQGILPAGSITSATRMVLVNAIYLKANWTNPFSTSDTRSAKFWIKEGKQVDVTMMHQRDGSCFPHYDETMKSDITVLGLREGVSMILVVPRAIGDFSTVYNDQHGSMGSKMSSLFDMIWTARGKATPRGTCDVYLPKFSLSYKMKEAKSLLRELGVRSIFSSNADFSRMTHSEEPLKVSGVFHRATIDVNENGVEASAATAVTILTRNAASVRMIDRPFLFAVRHDATGAILFAGKVTRPRADQ